jgi:hypothetical protein
VRKASSVRLPPCLPDPAIDLQLDLLGQHYDLRQPGRWHRSPGHRQLLAAAKKSKPNC